jgi:hypothetical protein
MLYTGGMETKTGARDDRIVVGNFFFNINLLLDREWDEAGVCIGSHGPGTDRQAIHK